MSLSSADLLRSLRTGTPSQRHAARAITSQLGEPVKAAEMPKERGGVAALRAARPVAGVMTKTEMAYARRLDAQKAAGEILGWDFEADRLKLADEVEGGRAKWFKVDFIVYHADGRLSYDEVKGAWISDAGRERWRGLASRYPLRWMRLWQLEKGRWTLKYESLRTRNER